MKKLATLCLLISTLNVATAQEVGAFRKQLYLKITPTSLLDPYGARLPVGIGYHFAERDYASIEYSIPLLRYIPFFDQGYQTIKSDIRLRIEYRRFISENRRAYLGVEGFIRNQELVRTSKGRYYDSNGGIKIEFNYTSGDVYKNIIGVGLIFGGDIRITNHIYFEPYCGLGIRNVEVHRENVRDLTQLPSQRQFDWFTQGLIAEEEEIEGGDMGLYVPCGVKINILLSRR